MISFLSIIIASLCVYFVNGWLDGIIDISIQAMIDLVVFIAVFMASNRYFKNLRD